MKKIENIINIEELSNYLTYSNTPRYLYKTFILDSGLFDVSNTLQRQDYIKLFDNFINAKDLSIKDFVIIYAVIISCVFKDLETAKTILNHKLIEKLKWGERLKEIILSNIKSDTSLSFEYNNIEYNSSVKNNNLVNDTNLDYKIPNDENIN